MGGARAMFTAHRIENGYIMQFFGDNGFHGRMIYCEKETDIPTVLITERAKHAINPHYSAGAQANLDPTVKSRY